MGARVEALGLIIGMYTLEVKKPACILPEIATL
jgi:hypothetical protein